MEPPSSLRRSRRSIGFGGLDQPRHPGRHHPRPMALVAAAALGQRLRRAAVFAIGLCTDHAVIHSKSTPSWRWKNPAPRSGGRARRWADGVVKCQPFGDPHNERREGPAAHTCAGTGRPGSLPARAGVSYVARSSLPDLSADAKVLFRGAHGTGYLI